MTGKGKQLIVSQSQCCLNIKIKTAAAVPFQEQGVSMEFVK
jgi:hypothetical protein